jgi:hypothetical protein
MEWRRKLVRRSVLRCASLDPLIEEGFYMYVVLTSLRFYAAPTIHKDETGLLVLVWYKRVLERHSIFILSALFSGVPGYFHALVISKLHNTLS